MKTIVNSDLMWKIRKIHHRNDRYVKLKLLFFYKSSGDICYWLNPTGSPKGFKIRRENFDNWENVDVQN